MPLRLKQIGTDARYLLDFDDAELAQLEDPNRTTAWGWFVSIIDIGDRQHTDSAVESVPAYFSGEHPTRF